MPMPQSRLKAMLQARAMPAPRREMSFGKGRAKLRKAQKQAAKRKRRK